ncbi:putative serine dehydratase [Aureococcus anophagefferens]|uniref:Serine dehydratase n=1 Tax=Aureococcus anophagefferens TaxID=44056 RepID=A0ABR1FMX1_AURAN
MRMISLPRLLSTTLLAGARALSAKPASAGALLRDVATPALCVDMDVFERNCETLKAMLADTGVKARPHAKAHKSGYLARAQLAILGDAAVVGPDKLRRLRAALDAAPGVVGASTTQAGAGRQLEQAVAGSSKTLDVYVEVDHVRKTDERKAKVGGVCDGVRATLAALEAAGIGCDVVTGGARARSLLGRERQRLYTEVQPGSFCLMDGDYLANDYDDAPFERSLAVVDAGSKAVDLVSGAPTLAVGSFRSGGDEHGIIDGPGPRGGGDHVGLFPPATRPLHARRPPPGPAATDDGDDSDGFEMLGTSTLAQREAEARDRAIRGEGEVISVDDDGDDDAVGEIRAELDALDKSQLDAMEKASSTNYYGGVDEARRRPVSLPLRLVGFQAAPALLPRRRRRLRRLRAPRRRALSTTAADARRPAWSALDDFCDGFDAALAPPYAACAAHDYETFCAPKKVEDDRRAARKLWRKLFAEPSGRCARGRRDDPGAGGALPCLWQAVARLPDVCDGSFAFSPPDDLAGGRRRTTASARARAVCTQCAAGGEFCGAVAERYGEEDAPPLRRDRGRPR